MAQLNLQVPHACCTLVFVRSIARGSNYHIRSLWINAHTYNLSFDFFFFRAWGDRRREECIFMGKERDRFEVIR